VKRNGNNIAGIGSIAIQQFSISGEAWQRMIRIISCGTAFCVQKLPIAGSIFGVQNYGFMCVCSNILLQTIVKPEL